MSRLQVDYVPADTLDAELARDDTLAVIGFAGHPATHADPRYLRVPLQPQVAAPLEVWRSGPGVRRGRDGNIAWASDGALTFGAIEIEEGDGGLMQASEDAYRQLIDFVRDSDAPHLLRVWNYLDSITAVTIEIGIALRQGHHQVAAILDPVEQVVGFVGLQSKRVLQHHHSVAFAQRRQFRLQPAARLHAAPTRSQGFLQWIEAIPRRLATHRQVDPFGDAMHAVEPPRHQYRDHECAGHAQRDASTARAHRDHPKLLANPDTRPSNSASSGRRCA